MKDNIYPGAYDTSKSKKIEKLNNLLAEAPIGYKGKFKEVLEDMQANILRHHHKEHSVCMFLHFKDANAALGWITNLDITSAKKQFDNYLENETEMVTSFYLTAKGYEALGVEHVAPFSREQNAFVEGMDKRIDLPKEKNFKDEKLYPSDGYSDFLDIHAMLYLASDDQGEIDKEVSLQGMRVSSFGSYTLQSGLMRFNNEGKVIDWFGFRDGISQPKFFPDVSLNKKSTLSLNDISPLRTVVTYDRGGEMWYSVGSFMAFLKLEQDVEAFDGMVTTVSNAINPSNPNRELAEAYIIGRFKDGTPVTIEDSPSTNSKDEPQNQFDYKGLLVKKTRGNKIEYLSDENGTRCPFHAHIRKANPRLGNAEARVIARRGVLYEEESKSGTTQKDADSTKVGMLFMSFQSSLEDQFEYILNRWILSPNMGGDSQLTGPDMLLGAVDGQNLSKWYVPTSWNTPYPDEKALVELNKACVHFKGGEYFFAPSLSFLKNLDRKHMSFAKTTVNRPGKNPSLGKGAIRIPPLIFKN